MPISFAERMRREKEDKYAQERGEAGLNRLSKKELIQHIQDLYAFENIFMVHENRSHPCRQKYDTLKVEIRKLKAEIETLKDAERKRDVRDYNDVFTKLKKENDSLKKANTELKNWFSLETFQLHANAFADPPERPYKTYTYDEYQACCDDTAESLGEMMRDAVPEAIEEWLGENYGSDDDE